MKKKVLLYVLGILCLACKQSKKDIAPIATDPKIASSSHNHTQAEIHKLYSHYIDENNVKGYNNLSVDLILDGQMEELFYYSVIMANRNNYSRAYYYAYYGLYRHPGNFNRDRGKFIDNKTKNLGLYYLIKSYELGYKEAKPDITDILKSAEIHNSEYYLNEYAR